MRAKFIYEVLSFKRGDENPLSNLGVGKVYLIKSWLDEMHITNYNINDNLTINVNGNIDLHNKKLVKFPDYIKFNRVKGSFDCSHNELVFLKGCPNYISKSFLCNNNKLISLEKCPRYVGRDCYINNNKLTSLKGCPPYTRGDFYCYDNEKRFTENEVQQLCNVEGYIYV